MEINKEYQEIIAIVLANGTVVISERVVHLRAGEYLLKYPLEFILHADETFSLYTWPDVTPSGFTCDVPEHILMYNPEQLYIDAYLAEIKSLKKNQEKTQQRIIN